MQHKKKNKNKLIIYKKKKKNALNFDNIIIFAN